jgi:hypothetical protein
MTTRLFTMTLVLIAAVAGPARSDDAADVLKRDDARIAAVLKADLAGLEDTFADGATYTHSTSAVDTKKDFIEGIRTGRLKYKAYDRKEAAVALYGDTAVVTGKAWVVVERAGADVEIRLQFTNVWVKRAGKWRMVAWQSTRLPEK